MIVIPRIKLPSVFYACTAQHDFDFNNWQRYWGGIVNSSVNTRAVPGRGVVANNWLIYYINTLPPVHVYYRGEALANGQIGTCSESRKTVFLSHSLLSFELFPRAVQLIPRGSVQNSTNCAPRMCRLPVPSSYASDTSTLHRMYIGDIRARLMKIVLPSQIYLPRGKRI